MTVTMIPIVIGVLGTIPKMIGKGTGRLRNQKVSGNHPDYNIIKIDLNTEKSSGTCEDLPSLKLQGKIIS